MEKHMFKFGGGSWAVILPKRWVEKNGANERSSLNMQEDELGNLLISTKGNGAEEAELVITSGLNPGVAGRWAGLYYRKGVKKLRIYSEDGNAGPQFNGIEEIVTRLCPGFEVISRSKNDMVLEDFTDIKEVSIDKIILRLKSIITEELNEAGTVSGEELGKLEGLVNRFFMLGIRYINVTQSKDAIKNFKLLQLLETISDQIYELSKQGIAPKVKPTFEKLKVEFDSCFKGLAGDGRAIEAAVAARESIYKTLRNTKSSTLGAYLTREISKNMVKVAELGLYVNQKDSI